MFFVVVETDPALGIPFPQTFLSGLENLRRSSSICFPVLPTWAYHSNLWLLVWWWISKSQAAIYALARGLPGWMVQWLTGCVILSRSLNLSEIVFCLKNTDNGIWFTCLVELWQKLSKQCMKMYFEKYKALYLLEGRGGNL